MRYIATFFSHYAAVEFAEYLKEMGRLAKLMPVPRAISTSCGTGVAFDTPYDTQEIFDGLDQIFLKEDSAYSRVYRCDPEA